MCTIPKILMLFRFILAPLSIILSNKYKTICGILIVFLICLSLISYILDGIIAKKYKVATEKLRRKDSLINIIFSIFIALSTWIISSAIVEQNCKFILSLIYLMAICSLISLLRFKKKESSHTYFSIFISDHNSVGYIAYVDVLPLILLPQWAHDVLSFIHANLIREKN